MLVRDATPDEVNAIANHDEVYDMLLLGAIHPQCALDYSSVMESPAVTTLIGGEFCAIFQWTSPACYEVHVMATKAYRGKEGMAISHAMLAEMKARGAKRVWGQPSAYNKPAQQFVRRMGLWYQGTGHNAVIGDVKYYEMDL